MNIQIAHPKSIALVVLGLMAGCSGSGGDGPAPPSIDATKLIPTCFVGGTDPQLDLDGPVANWTWNDPHVLRTATGYWMYASATDGFVFPVRSYRLSSTDGESWALDTATPILADGAADSWDAGGIETPAVVLFAGRHHLFYTGYAHVFGSPEYSVLEFGVGHAASDDGLTFVRERAGPLISPSGTSDSDPSNDWYAFVVGEPAPLLRDGVLHVYFTAVGADAALGTSLQVIGRISTTDGQNWTAPERVLAPDQVLYPRSADWVGYSTPNAMLIGNEVHLFFDVAHQPAGGVFNQRHIHHARSADGLQGWIHDQTAIRSIGDFAWAVDEIHSPSALLDGTTLRLYLAGRELNGVLPEHFGVGMVECSLQ